MPWSKGNKPTAFKKLTGDDLDKALAIANGVLRRCLRKGGSDKECAPKAIRIALSKIKEKKMSETAVEEKTADAAVEETATDATVESWGEGISFSISLSESNITEEDDVVKVPATLIEQGWSLNDRYYSTSLLRKMSSILEGAGSFDSHIKTAGVKDYNGFYSGLAVKESAGPTGRDALTGIFNVIDPQMQRLVKHAPHLVKLSINGKGAVRHGIAEGREGLIVEDVDEKAVWSCDTVIRAGARGGIGAVLEAFEEQGEKMDVTSLSDLKKAFPNLLEEFKAEITAVLQEEGETKDLKADLQETQSELEKAVKAKDEAERKVAVWESQNILEQKLSEAKLPETLAKRVRKQFENQVIEAEKVDEVIEDFKGLAKELAEAAQVDRVKDESDESDKQREEDLRLLSEAGLIDLDGDE